MMTLEMHQELVAVDSWLSFTLSEFAISGGSGGNVYIYFLGGKRLVQ